METIREKLEQAADVGHLTRRTIDGEEAVDIRFTAERFGQVATTHMLMVPRGERRFFMMYAVGNEDGDAVLWNQLIGGLELHGPGIPWRSVFLYGMPVLVLGLWLLSLRGGSGRRRRRPLANTGFSGPESTTSGTAAPATVGGAPTSAPPLAAPTAPTAPAVRQLPGLRSTLPPGGQWQDGGS